MQEAKSKQEKTKNRSLYTLIHFCFPRIFIMLTIDSNLDSHVFHQYNSSRMRMLISSCFMQEIENQDVSFKLLHAASQPIARSCNVPYVAHAEYLV